MNLFDFPENFQDEELVDVLLENQHVRVERIVSHGQQSGWYNQEEDEMVFLLQGLAKLEYEDGAERTLKTGDSLLLPAGVKHRVSYTSAQPPCVWLCVFYS